MAKAGKPAGFTELRCSVLERVAAAEGGLDWMFRGHEMRAGDELKRMGLVDVLHFTAEQMLLHGIKTQAEIDADYEYAGTREIMWCAIPARLVVTEAGDIALTEWRRWSGKSVH